MEGRVLIIEDLDGNRELLKKQFESEDIDVAEAITGQEGIREALRFMPQVILLSTSLPDMTGADVAERLRSFNRTQHVHLIMIADEENQQQRIDGLALGANDFVTCPFDPEEVTLRVGNALHRANMANRTDPTTGIPAGVLVQDQLRDLLRDPEGDWALMRFRVRFIDPFREAYGFMAGEEMLRGVARILAEALAADDIQEDFLGYGGNDDFIIVTGQERAATLESEVADKFAQEVGSHYNFFDRESGHITVEDQEYPLARLRSRTITPADGPFYDIRSLTEELAG